MKKNKKERRSNDGGGDDNNNSNKLDAIDYPFSAKEQWHFLIILYNFFLFCKSTLFLYNTKHLLPKTVQKELDIIDDVFMW